MECNHSVNMIYEYVLKNNYNVFNYTTIVNELYSISLEDIGNENNRMLVYLVNQELDKILKAFWFDINDNIYRYGSRVYGTASETSDYDYIIVQKEEFGMYGQECIQRNSDGIDFTIYTPKGFEKQVNDYEISALECVYLPRKMIVLGKSFPAPSTIDLGKLRSAISAKASNSFVKAKKKFIVEKDRNILVGKKSLFHSLRIPIFGQQIARYGKITDYSAANHYWSDINANTSENWDDYQKIYKPIHNYEMTEFRKYCPKG